MKYLSCKSWVWFIKIYAVGATKYMEWTSVEIIMLYLTLKDIDSGLAFQLNRILMLLL